MAVLSKPLVLNETLQAMVDNPPYVEALEGIKNNLGAIALAQTSSRIGTEMDMGFVARLVRSGMAKNYFNIGDQITVPWTDPVDNQEFDFIWNVAHFPESVTLQNGDTTPGMILVANYAHRYGIPFSAPQAIQWFENGLEAGTYYLTFEQAFGNELPAGSSVNFTLTQDIPAGGQLAGNFNSSKAVAQWTFSTYADNTSATPIETVTPVIGQSGTDLGVLTTANAAGLNQSHSSYGNNRYRDSAIRQWLNSEGGVGSWWTPQHNFDRPPAEAATKSGFLAGFDADFLAAVRPIKIDIAANTICDGGETHTVYDRFFLPSIEELHYRPQVVGVEGTAWDYYRRASLSENPLPTGTAFAQMRHFGLESHASAQYVRLRSAFRGYVGYAWYVGTSGGAYNNAASGANRALAACCIC